MDMPPTRYRVIEQDRRLVVIDTQTVGRSFGGSGPVIPRSQIPKTPRDRVDTQSLRTGLQRRVPIKVTASPVLSMNERGDRVLTTTAWMDDKGPRKITISGYSATNMVDKARSSLTGVVIGWLAVSFFVLPLFLLPAVLFVPGVRRALRARLTFWLDQLDQASTGSSVG